jgi:hypothetical protein
MNKAAITAPAAQHLARSTRRPIAIASHQLDHATAQTIAQAPLSLKRRAH